MSLESNILIIAGEASGDQHGASLMEEIKLIAPNLNLFGIGGDKMITQGLNAVYHIRNMAFLGFTEIIRHLPFIKKVQRDIVKTVKEKNIKHAILIDYPGFNLSIAKKLKKIGIKIFYYISPQLWAWRKGRINKIKKLVDKMIVIFPFEKKMYDEAGIDCEYVGHPLVEQISEYPFLTKDELFAKLNLDTNKEILLIMPGSRKQEVRKIFPEIINAAEKLCVKYNMQPVIARAGNISESLFFENHKFENIKIVKGYTYDLLKHSKFGIIKSGTSTLEAGYFGLPGVIVYITSKVTYTIGKALIKINNIALANIVAGETIYDELIQNDVNEKNIFEKSDRILGSETIYNSIKNKLEIIKVKLTKEEASKKAAKVIVTSLNEL
ncbi:MAG: lipid-A-disaccharide synthase [Ignavibacteriae bacterium]|nr:lipid-A-disaccharide synthase [Ignavibacteriota bacterium]NOG96956.1 lipid-A-disaccharide synthase [Ignavibacteriota bacterium]